MGRTPKVAIAVMLSGVVPDKAAVHTESWAGGVHETWKSTGIFDVDVVMC